MRAADVRPRWLAALAAAALFAPVQQACGDPSSSEPSPEVIATAESVAREVSFPAQFSTTPAPDDADREPIVLDGRIFGDGEVGIILAHMRPADQSSWWDFATQLAATGDYTVLTFDFRGYGESTGEKQFDRIDTDLEAAYAYMRSDLDIDEIFVVGASMGGTAALVAGPRLDTAGIVSISSPSQFPDIDAEQTVGDITEPKLFITSQDDVPAYRSHEIFWERSQPPKERHIFPGDAHGTDILATEHGPELERRIIGFIERHSAALGAAN